MRSCSVSTSATRRANKSPPRNASGQRGRAAPDAGKSGARRSASDRRPSRGRPAARRNGRSRVTMAKKRTPTTARPRTAMDGCCDPRNQPSGGGEQADPRRPIEAPRASLPAPDGASPAGPEVERPKSTGAGRLTSVASGRRLIAAAPRFTTRSASADQPVGGPPAPRSGHRRAAAPPRPLRPRWRHRGLRWARRATGAAVAEQCPCQRDPLPLASGEACTAFPERGIEPLGQAGDQSVSPASIDRLPRPHRGHPASQPHVLLERSGEQMGSLRHPRHSGPPCLRVEVARSVPPTVPSRLGHEAEQHRQQRRLPAAARPGQADTFPGSTTSEMPSSTGVIRPG